MKDTQNGKRNGKRNMAWRIEQMAELIDKVELVKAVRESRKNNPHTDGSIARNHDTEHCHFLSLISSMPTTNEAEIRAKAIDEFAEKLIAEIETFSSAPVFLNKIEIVAEELKEAK